MNNFQNGALVPVSFLPYDGSATTVLQIKSHNLDLEALMLDVSHSGTGGVRARIAGLQDARATILASLDLDLLPWAAVPKIIPGLWGLIGIHVAERSLGWNPITVPVIVQKIHFESAVESEVKYSFDVQMNALAGAFSWASAA